MSRSCAAPASPRTSSTSRPSSATPPTTSPARAFLQLADGLLAEREADLVVVSCWSALQYTAAVAVARARAPAAAGGRDRRQRSPRLGAPGRLQRPGRALRLAHRRRGRDGRAHAGGAGAPPASARRAPATRSRARRCRSTPRHLPDYAAYPYTAEGLPELGLFLSRGCPYNAPACLLRPGGAGWHAYPPDVAVAAIDGRRRPAPGPGRWCSTRRSATRPAGGAPSSTCWRPATAATSRSRHRPPRRTAAPGRRQALQGARRACVLEVGTLSPALLARTGQAPYPQKAVAHALELLEYANAKGVVTRARFDVQPAGRDARSRRRRRSTRSSASSLAVPNTSVTLDAQPWAYLPVGEEGADVDAPASRFGTRIEHPEWWKERVDAHTAATARRREPRARRPAARRRRATGVRASRSCASALAAKLTADARRGLRSHETVGSGAYGVPHGWWTEPRWH